MDVRVYAISPDKKLAAASLEEFRRRRDDGQAYFWIDVLDSDPARLTELLSSLSLHPLIIDRCLDPQAAAVVAPYPGTVFAHFPSLTSWDDLRRSFLSVLCLPRAIITIHAAGSAVLDDLISDFTAALGHHDLSTSAVLYLIMDRLIDETTASALAARQAVNSLEQLMHEGMEPEQLGRRILALKRAAAHFEMGAEEQHRCVAALMSLETDSFSVRGLREYFHDALSHLEHDLQYAERTEARLSELERHNLLLLQDKTNRRLNILTVLSAVFMPLTLITGVYGMNFRNMPELVWPYGYFLTLGIMIGIGGGLLWFFYRRDWFK